MFLKNLMTKKVALFIITAGIFLVSADGGCKQGNESAALNGTWKLEKTNCCGRGMKMIIPEKGTIKTITFQEEGKYKEATNGITSKEGVFSLRKGINDYQYSVGDSANVVLFDSLMSGYITYLKDTLVISFGYMDLQTDFYTKKKK